MNNSGNAEHIIRVYTGFIVLVLLHQIDLSLEQIAEILNEVIKKGAFKPVNVTVVSAIIIGTMDGIMIQWLLDRNIFKIKPALEQLAELIVSGMRKTD